MIFTKQRAKGEERSKPEMCVSYTKDLRILQQELFPHQSLLLAPKSTFPLLLPALEKHFLREVQPKKKFRKQTSEEESLLLLNYENWISVPPLA